MVEYTSLLSFINRYSPSTIIALIQLLEIAALSREVLDSPLRQRDLWPTEIDSLAKLFDTTINYYLLALWFVIHVCLYLVQSRMSSGRIPKTTT